MTPKRLAKYYLLRFRRLRGDPKSLAKGSALGVFMAFMPISPVRSIVLVACTTVFKANVFAAFIVATALCNPFTYVPLYYAALVVGNAITPFSIDWGRVVIVFESFEKGFVVAIQSVGTLGVEVIAVLLIGGLAMAVPAGLLTYTISLRYFLNRNRGQN
jgi:hypothetical protein